jgi:cyclopropane-fatty-acyl-phospholipid synthase
MFDERFCRMWEFYLLVNEKSFQHRSLAVFQLQIAKQIDAVPITRDYLYRNEAVAAPESQLLVEHAAKPGATTRRRVTVETADRPGVSTKRSTRRSTKSAPADTRH